MYARSLHWIHTVACLSLYVTGLILFIPSVAAAVGAPGSVKVSS